MDLSWHALTSMVQVKTLYHTEKQGLGYLWLSKEFQTHPLGFENLSCIHYFSIATDEDLCSAGAYLGFGDRGGL